MGKRISILAPIVILLLTGAWSVDESLASGVNTQSQSVSSTESSKRSGSSAQIAKPKETTSSAHKAKKTTLRIANKKHKSTKRATSSRTSKKKDKAARLMRNHFTPKAVSDSPSDASSVARLYDRAAYAPLDFWLARAMDEQERQADRCRLATVPYHYRGYISIGADAVLAQPSPVDDYWPASRARDQVDKGRYALMGDVGPEVLSTQAERVITPALGHERRDEEWNGGGEDQLTDLWLVKTMHAGNEKQAETEPADGLTYKILETACNYLGVRYQYGGTTPEGFDCSGFVRYVFSENGIQLGRSSRDQAQAGMHVPLSALKPGDLIFFSMRSRKHHRIDHVGLYIGDGQFIHAASSRSRQIMISDLKSVHYQSRVVTARRVTSVSP